MNVFVGDALAADVEVLLPVVADDEAVAAHQAEPLHLPRHPLLFNPRHLLPRRVEGGEGREGERGKGKGTHDFVLALAAASGLLLAFLVVLGVAGAGRGLCRLLHRPHRHLRPLALLRRRHSRTHTHTTTNDSALQTADDCSADLHKLEWVKSVWRVAQEYQWRRGGQEA